MEQVADTASPWWGEFDIERGAQHRWLIGPMTLWIERLDGEWRIATVIDTGEDTLRAEQTDVGESQDLMALDTVVRVGTSSASHRVRITPLLADRAVVTRPIKPFYVAPGETLDMFVGSPLWLRIEAVVPGHTLHEFPIVRPSDTWFGDDTMSGELCYASRTQCRLRQEELPARPHRAVTMVTVHNKAAEPLLLERMKLPVTHLPLYQSGDGAFWTRDIAVTHQSTDGMASVRHRDAPPSLARNVVQVSPARTRSGENLAMKMFSTLFR